MPTDVNAARDQVLAQAHKTWRRDAIVTEITLMAAPSGVNVKPEKFWLSFALFSPSNLHSAFVTTNGGPDDLVINESTDLEPERAANMHAIEHFAIDLPAALATAHKTGLNDAVTNVSLRVGATRGNPPVLAWIMHLSSQVMFPLVIDAQTGEELSWKRVMAPPTTDRQIAEAWQKFLHRNDRHGGGGGRVDCFVGVSTSDGMCLTTQGYVDPATGYR